MARSRCVFVCFTIRCVLLFTWLRCLVIKVVILCLSVVLPTAETVMLLYVLTVNVEVLVVVRVLAKTPSPVLSLTTRFRS